MDRQKDSKRGKRDGLLHIFFSITDRTIPITTVCRDRIVSAIITVAEFKGETVCSFASLALEEEEQKAAALLIEDESNESYNMSAS